jgi:hypothetical protein
MSSTLERDPTRHRPGLLALSLLLLAFAPGCQDSGSSSALSGDLVTDLQTLTVLESTTDPATIVTYYNKVPTSYSWVQLSGPAVPYSTDEWRSVSLDLTNFFVAVDTEVKFELDLTQGNNGRKYIATFIVEPAVLEPVLAPFEQIGGSTVAVAKFRNLDGQEWVLYNTANRLLATPVTFPAGDRGQLVLEGFIHDIEVVLHLGRRFALAALGTEGIAVVDLLDPMHPQLLSTVRVNYQQGGIAFSDGGGNITFDNEIASDRGSIVDLWTDGTDLWIANLDFGIQRTALANLLPPSGPVVDTDGTLWIDAETFTLQFAGEVPWGGPEKIRPFGGKLFVAQGFLGLGIFDPVTLEQIGRYNLYTDASIDEDWFLDLDLAAVVQSDPLTGEPYLDASTGMPDYRQASYEVLEVWHGGGVAPTPWADFDRYGKYYYNAHSVDVATFAGTTVASIAYGLAGTVVVDVTGFQAATAAASLTADYLGYFPPVPTHGPDEETGSDSTQSLYPHSGSGRLKEAGVIDVCIHGTRLCITDHFAGLAIIEGLDDFAAHGHGASAPYDNDDPTLGSGVLGDHLPEFEFVTSYDMTPHDPLDHESLPACYYESPCVLVTGEVSGHGNRFLLTDGIDIEHSGTLDVALCSGAGGFSFVDLELSAIPDDEFAHRFTVAASFATTDEVGAAPDGSPEQPISVGHADGIGASSTHVYLADGPHGVSAWRIVDQNGSPTDDVHVVGNTVQDEYPVDVGGATVYPAPHAHGLVYEPSLGRAIAVCRTAGIRLLDVDIVEQGPAEIGFPGLLGLGPQDIFEHNGDAGSLPAMSGQDHAQDVAVHGGLAYVADGNQGVTIYDLSRDPSDLSSGFFVANIGASGGGGGSSGGASIGRTSGIVIHEGPKARTYAFVACGPKGIGVIDVTDPLSPEIVKVFEPIKLEIEEDGSVHVGKADGRAVDVAVVGDLVFYTYDSFGVLAYRIADLIEELPEGVDPTEIWTMHGFDHRPGAMARFRLQDADEYAGFGGGALGLATVDVGGRTRLYVAYATAGLAVIDWSAPAEPALEALLSTAGECTAVTIANGRLYIADGAGGIVSFK